MTIPPQHLTPGATFAPYVAATDAPKEFSVGAIVLGVLLGLVFAASSIYLALKVSLTVSASIPIAVLSITIFRYVSRAFGQQPATILQNNLVQTTGSAGESIAAGIAFTLPALLLLGYELPWTTVMAIGIVGGILGVLFLVPLRRSLIVREHGALKYPEGTACAQVLIVGEERGVQAKTVFMGFGLGAAYKFLNAGLHIFLEVPRRAFTSRLANGQTQLFGEIQAEISPELTGVGYIIGPRIAGFLFAGGVLSYFCLIPAIKLFGAGLTEPIFPATILIKDMTAGQVRSNYVFYIGAGAVTAAGLISLAKGLPTIWGALVAGLGDFRGTKSGEGTARTDRDLPMSVVLFGTLSCLAAMVFLPQIGINIAGGILAIFFAFLFVTVSARITGQIGSSSNPVSGMTVATLLLTSLMFLAVGWVGIEHRVLALSIGGVVCVAASTAGATSQDLKTGFLVGATPRYQQIGLLIGVTASALLVGGIIQFLNDAKTTIVPKEYPGVQVSVIERDARFALSNGRMVAVAEASGAPSYRVGRLYEQTGNALAGKYLVDDAGAIKYVVDPGVGGRERVNYDGREIEKLDSPKAQIMALVVDGILTQKLPWGLILVGAFLAIAVELVGIASLPVAVGVYLPISTSATMFVGGVIRWLVDRRKRPEEREGADADSGPGVLFSSGLIAGGAIMGVVLVGLAARQWDQAFNLTKTIGALGESNLLSVVFYVVLLAVPLYLVARRVQRTNG
ncbi:MAG TPA: oligopeptide transporter, OPT family [Gemmatimonadaceae bacterium]|nr:oligopeptide transporter, OPT family [Gemmatimonadaceae bacterium]